MQGALERGEHRGLGVEPGPDGRSPVVGRAAAAEGDPVVGGPLAVDDQVALVGEGLGAAQADGLPGRRVERLGGDHQRVDRGHRPTGGGQGGGPRLGGAQHVAGPYRAARGAHPPGFDVHDPRALEDRHAPGLDGVGQAADQRQRLDPRAVGGPGGAEHVAGGKPCACRVGVQQLDLVAPPPGLLGLGPGPGELDRGAGERERPADAEPAVDALGRAHPADLAHGLAHGGPHRRCRRLAVPARQRRGRGGEQRGAPATVAAARAEPDVLGLEHDHCQRGVALGEVVRGPEPGQAGAHHHDVRREPALERAPAGGRVPPGPPTGRSVTAAARPP